MSRLLPLLATANVLLWLPENYVVVVAPVMAAVVGAVVDGIMAEREGRIETVERRLLGSDGWRGD